MYGSTVSDEKSDVPPVGTKTEVMSAVVGIHRFSSFRSMSCHLKPTSMSLSPFNCVCGPPERGWLSDQVWPNQNVRNSTRLYTPKRMASSGKSYAFVRVLPVCW